MFYSRQRFKNNNRDITYEISTCNHVKGQLMYYGCVEYNAFLLRNDYYASNAAILVGHHKETSVYFTIYKLYR